MAATAQDRYNINSQLELLQSKYVGTGHPDTSRFEWNVNIKRDTYASFIGHYPILSYHAVAENESIGRIKYGFKQASRPRDAHAGAPPLGHRLAPSAALH
jgi:splicing factor 3B subunit 5